MSKLLAYSSLTKKFIMAFAGLFLVIFLVVHLVINLLLMSSDGGEAFNNASHFMATNPLIKVMEIVLLAGILIHGVLGTVLWVQNRLSRPERYQKTNESKTSFFSKFMIHTGIIILVFLIIHFINFYFVKLGITSAPEGIRAVASDHDFYSMSINLFTNKIYSIIYVVCFIFLGFHLNHSIQSGFQSLGWYHEKYTPAIKLISTVYSIIISVGFAIIPIYFLFFFNA